jgi:multidrug resistance protein
VNRALAFIFITVLIDAIGFGVVIPVFPQLIVKLTGRDLANAAEVSGWIAFLYASVQFLMGPVIGGLSDRFGRRPVLLASMAAFSLDYVVMAFAPTLWWLVAARVVAGITGATFPTAYAYIADVTPPEKRGANFGVIGMAFGFGFIIGPALGGFVAQFGTEVPFLVSAGLATANLDRASDIISCPGLDYCTLANARSIPIAQKLAVKLAPQEADLGELKIKVSGCINGCGHHHAGHIGILGVDRKGEENYQLLLGGSGAEDATLAKILGPGFDENGIVTAVEKVIDRYKTLRADPAERFLDTYRRVGAEPFKEAVYG